MKNKKRLMLYSIIFLVALSIFGVQKIQPKLHSIIIDDCFDTVSEITVYSRTDKPLKKCESYLKKLHSELTISDENSSLSQYNNGSTVNFSKDVSELIKFGEDFTKKHSEYFSIYLCPLEKAWDVKNNNGTIPDVQKALAESNTHRQISLGAVTKGYACDRLVEMLKKDKITSALINLGGNTYAMGKKPDGSLWKIGVQDPKNPDNIIGRLNAENLAIVTSGDYQRYFEVDGTRYHHIFDPKTGYPSKSGLRSVTIISENAALADSLSTAIFVAGVEKGKELLKEYNVRGILITDDTIYFSKSLENIFKQDDFSYKYEFIY